jgi:hypothetical protein
MNLTNQEMDIYVRALEKISGKVKGKLAYAVARNIRKLSTELVEFQNMSNEAITKFGYPNENGTYTIRIDSDEYKKYLAEMQGVQNIENEVDLMKVSQDVLEESDLNAQEMLSIDFMITEE